jgi:hypothetical protein
LGQLALAWNDLQESLKGLFWVLMNPRPQEGDLVNYVPVWVWHSIKSDRSQRHMLKAAVTHLPVNWERSTLVEDVTWLINRAESLEDARNDAIHSPLFAVNKSLYGMQYETPIEKIAPARWLFNPRAIGLAKRKNLLGEFRYCRDTAITLADYAQLIERALINPGRPWPDRPSLPSRLP